MVEVLPSNHSENFTDFWCFVKVTGPYSVFLWTKVQGGHLVLKSHKDTIVSPYSLTATFSSELLIIH